MTINEQMEFLIDNLITTEKEIELVKDLLNKEYSVEIRMVPTDKKIDAKDVI